MKSNRNLTKEEVDLIEYLAAQADYSLCSGWNKVMCAYPITEEKIGPIALLANKNQEYVQHESFDIASCRFIDADKVEVVAYLLVDKDNLMYELDLWKVDNTPIKRIPSKENFKDVLSIK